MIVLSLEGLIVYSLSSVFSSSDVAMLKSKSGNNSPKIGTSFSLTLSSRMAFNR